MAVGYTRASDFGGHVYVARPDQAPVAYAAPGNWDVVFWGLDTLLVSGLGLGSDTAGPNGVYALALDQQGASGRLLIGGLGPCGRPLCCASFLDEFYPISIRMAKEQHLPLKPAKISGVCGRLMCCLRYEQDSYRRFMLWVPAVGEKVDTERGPARVVAHDMMNEKVTLELAASRSPGR